MERITKYIGKDTIERMTKTKYYALAHFISELRYNLSDPDKDHYQIQKMVHVGENKHFDFAKEGTSYVDSNKVLKLIEEELEGLALKEVT